MLCLSLFLLIVNLYGNEKFIVLLFFFAGIKIICLSLFLLKEKVTKKFKDNPNGSARLSGQRHQSRLPGWDCFWMRSIRRLCIDVMFVSFSADASFCGNKKSIILFFFFAWTKILCLSLFLMKEKVAKKFKDNPNGSARLSGQRHRSRLLGKGCSFFLDYLFESLSITLSLPSCCNFFR